MLRLLLLALPLPPPPPPPLLLPPPSLNQRQPQRPRRQQQYQQIDRDQNGIITRAELIKAIRADPSIWSLLGLPDSGVIRDDQRVELESIFQSMDADNSRGIDQMEFSAYMESRFPHGLSAVLAHRMAAAAEAAAEDIHFVHLGHLYICRTECPLLEDTS
jgi:Ca2+-binding EF-hand superfamily protein